MLLQGNFGGALLFRRALEAAGCKVPVDVAEMDASPFGARILAPDQVVLTGLKQEWRLASAPARRINAVFSRVVQAFPGMRPASNLFETGFCDVGAVFHAVGVVTTFRG